MASATVVEGRNEVSEWLSAKPSRDAVRIGKGATWHLFDGADTLCGKGDNVTSVDTGELVKLKPCQTCTTKLDALMAEQPAESADQADDAGNRDAQVASITELIDEAASILNENKPELVSDVLAKFEARLEALSGDDAEQLREQFRAEWDAEIKEAALAADLAKASDGEIVTRETLDYTEDAELVALRDQTVKAWAKGIRHEIAGDELALQIAVLETETVVRLKDKNGHPDWDRKSKGAKSLKQDTLNLLAKRVGRLDQDQATPAVKKLMNGVTNRRRDALVLHVRGLDEKPELARELWGTALEAHPELSPSEAVFAWAGMPSLTRAEAAKARRALGKGATNDAVNGDPASKGDPEDDGDADNGDGASTEDDNGLEHTPRILTNLRVLEEEADKALNNWSKIKDDHTRAAARTKLKALLAKLEALGAEQDDEQS